MKTNGLTTLLGHRGVFLVIVTALSGILTFSVSGCTTTEKKVKTVQKVEIEKFMGDWYVLAGRFTFLDVDVHNALERYAWNQDEQRIDVDFTYNKGSLTGPQKLIPQKAWVYDQETKAHWKVSPLWPFKFDYLIVDLDENYQWTAIGVPDQKYLWIMARHWEEPEQIIQEAVRRLEAKGYDTKNLIRVPQQWPAK
jgi:apolipoprotein D and lipocalin family protein